MRALIIAGMPGAGKEELVAVAQGLKWNVVRMGDVVRAEATRQVVPTARSTGQFAHEQRQVHGTDIWAKRTLQAMDASRTVIDGCRSQAEAVTFRRELGEELQVLAVHSSPRTRYPRLVSRGRSDAPANWDEFQERDRREMGWGLGDLIATADIMIVNEGSLQDFKSECQEILRSLSP
ncbi:MAG: AAA family ATPase [Methanomassiliicoccales archaeon]